MNKLEELERALETIDRVEEYLNTILKIDDLARDEYPIDFITIRAALQEAIDNAKADSVIVKKSEYDALLEFKRQANQGNHISDWIQVAHDDDLKDLDEALLYLEWDGYHKVGADSKNRLVMFLKAGDKTVAAIRSTKKFWPVVCRKVKAFYNQKDAT